MTRTAGTSGGAAQCVPGLGLANSCDPICDRQEFTTREIRAIQRSEDFPTILEWTLESCPAVAAVLTNTATATTATELTAAVAAVTLAAAPAVVIPARVVVTPARAAVVTLAPAAAIPAPRWRYRHGGGDTGQRRW
ncbi:MAG: hypothetical protein R3D46_16845 [Defluviimonas denitrificans]